MVGQSRASAKAISAILSLGLLADVAPAQTQPADSTQPTVAQLQARIAALESKVQSVQTTQEEQTAEKAAVLRQMLADADSQTELSSTYDPSVGFVIRSPDGLFSLHPGVVLDFRNMTSSRASVAPKAGGEVAKLGYDTQNGFDLTRARLSFDGIFTKNITYFVQFSADQGAAASLLDAYWTYHFTDSPFAVKVGQFKDPEFHERNLSEANLLAVDRSLTESLLGGGQTSRVQGVDLMYDQDRVRAQLAFHDGYDSLNTKFFDAGGIGAGVSGGSGVTPTDFGASGRAEYLVIGQRTADLHPFNQYDGGFSALGAAQDFLIAGGGFDYSQAGDNDVIFHTADVQYDTASGFSAYGAYLGTYRDIHSSQGVTAGKPVTPPGHFYDPGAVIQIAYLITPKFEPFARYDYTYLNGASVSGFGLNTSEAQEVTVGANYYLYKQHAKITVDGSWLPNGSPVDADALGILQDSGHPEYVLRVQFQLAI